MVLEKVPGMTAPETMTIRTTHTRNRRSNHLSHEIAQSFIIYTRIIDFRTKVNARSHPCTRSVPPVLARGFICHPYSVQNNIFCRFFLLVKQTQSFDRKNNSEPQLVGAFFLDYSIWKFMMSCAHLSVPLYHVHLTP